MRKHRPACEKGEDDPDWRTVVVANHGADFFRVILQSNQGNRVTANYTVYPTATVFLKFRGSFCKPISFNNYTFSMFKQQNSLKPIGTARNREMPIEPMLGPLSVPRWMLASKLQEIIPHQNSKSFCVIHSKI
ncbi:hypothetical protein U1Q18_050575 [Sarracenia purpurea var. burkii]